MSAQEDKRKRGDIRLAVEQLLREHPEMRQQEIAARVGCTQGFVSTVRRDNIASGKIVLPAERVDALGRKRPTSYSGKKETVEAKPAEDAEPYVGGKMLAELAIMDLEQIKPNDAERKQAFALVLDWIEKREAQALERDGNGNPTR